MVPAILRGERWLPDDYKYPSFPRHLAAGAARIALALSSRSPPVPIAEPSATFYENYDPPAILLSGRFVAFAFSLGTIALTALLTRAAAGHAAGLAAAWLAAWCPALVIRSGNATVDPQAAFFVLLALFAVERAIAEHDRPRRWAALAGVAIGCALTTKYPSVLVSLPVFLRIGSGLASNRIRAEAMLCVAAGASAAAIVTMPGFVLDTAKVVEWLRIQAQWYSGPTTPSLLSQALRVAEWDTEYGSPELGLPFLVLLIAATLFGLLRRSSRGFAAACTLFALSLWLLHSRYSFQAFRNLVPAVAPCLALLGVSFHWLRERTPYRTAVDLLLCALPLALFATPLVTYVYERSQIVDSRVEALQWLAARSNPDDRIWIASEAGVLGSEAGRLSSRVSTAALAEAEKQLRRDRFRFVLSPQLSENDHRALTAGGLGRQLSLVATFGDRAGPAEPWRYRGNRPRVLVFEAKPRNRSPEPWRSRPGRKATPAAP